MTARSDSPRFSLSLSNLVPSHVFPKSASRIERKSAGARAGATKIETHGWAGRSGTEKRERISSVAGDRRFGREQISSAQRSVAESVCAFTGGGAFRDYEVLYLLTLDMHKRNLPYQNLKKVERVTLHLKYKSIISNQLLQVVDIQLLHQIIAWLHLKFM